MQAQAVAAATDGASDCDTYTDSDTGSLSIIISDSMMTIDQAMCDSDMIVAGGACRVCQCLSRCQCVFASLSVCYAGCQCDGVCVCV
jgi:hypothetical protein